MKRWRPLVFFIVYFSVFVSIPAANQKSTNGYQALLDLHGEFSKFRRPQIVGGIPDYSPAAMKMKEEDLKTFRQRLADINPGG